ncbi:MAG: Fe-S cluster assembly ATPase SufC [Candidatus Shikimatogenerans bostrichidophilus]|nr:MAG: Fe-S cluster assembly ATPase SufC [Candidatus Shikimatogenerans bostrichidophilus]
MLIIKNLYVKIKNNLIIKKLNLKINKGEIHILMGPNGSGKSSLSYTITRKVNYNIYKGKIKFNNKLINKLNTYEVSKLGIFLSFQYPIEIYGITMFNFLKNLFKKNKNKYIKYIFKLCNKLDINKKYLNRYFNYGFSGGEKKKNEILQMLILKPKFSILDEIDSGLDIDSLKIIFNNIKYYIKKKKDSSFLIITHNTNIINYIKPNFIHILYNGKIIKTGNLHLLNKINKYGYKNIINF